MPRYLLALILLPGFLLSSCSSTKLVNSWRPPDYQGSVLKQMLIIGMFKDDLHRRSFEDAFQAGLSRKGVEGIVSYAVMPTLPDENDEEAIKTIVAEAGVEAVLVARLTSVDEEESYVPPRVDYLPAYGGYYGPPGRYGRGYYGYYRHSYQVVYQPGYTTTNTVVRLETRVFSENDGQLLWAGDTESFNPSSAETVIRELTSIILKDMQAGKLL